MLMTFTQVAWDNQMLDQTAAQPLTPAEKLQAEKDAQQGKLPSMELCRRFIATIRKAITSVPKVEASAKKTRDKKPKTTEDQIDFF